MLLHRKLILLFLVAIILTSVIYNVYADEDEDEVEDENEDSIFGEDTGKLYGSVAWVGGLFLNSVFVVVNRARKMFRLRIPFRYILDIHILTNIILGALGVIHGYSYMSRAGPAEYLAVSLIVILLISGLFLRYISSRNMKLLSRLVHGQLLLSIILALVLGYHVATIED